MSRTLLKRIRAELQDDATRAGLVEAIDQALSVGGKYQTGHYLLVRFDRYGTKLDTKALGSCGLVEGAMQGRASIQAGECESAAVTRVVWNSRDDAWGNR